jgi:hypothetical protein
MEVRVEICSQVYRVAQERKNGEFSVSVLDDDEGWGMMILSITLGLFALGFFLALGGIFALIGPWMVFAVAHLVRQKWARKAGEHLRQQAIELVASIRSHTKSRLTGELWGRNNKGFANGEITRVWPAADFLTPSSVVL